MNATTSLSLITSTATDLGVGVLAIFGIVLGIAVGVFLVKWGYTHLIHNFDYSIKIGGYYPLKTPYKGYNRFKSESWNMEHTT